MRVHSSLPALALAITLAAPAAHGQVSPPPQPHTLFFLGWNPSCDWEQKILYDDHTDAKPGEGGPNLESETDLDYVPVAGCAREDPGPPVPALIWVHGGGMTGGSKNNFPFYDPTGPIAAAGTVYDYHTQVAADGKFTESEISGALGSHFDGLHQTMALFSINYPLSYTTQEGYVNAYNDPQGGYASVQRAIQFVRFNHLYFNIDPNRVAVGGNSFGAQSAVLAILTGDVATGPPGFLEAESSVPDAVWCNRGPSQFLDFKDNANDTYFGDCDQDVINWFGTGLYGEPPESAPLSNTWDYRFCPKETISLANLHQVSAVSWLINNCPSTPIPGSVLADPCVEPCGVPSGCDGVQTQTLPNSVPVLLTYVFGDDTEHHTNDCYNDTVDNPEPYATMDGQGNPVPVYDWVGGTQWLYDWMCMTGTGLCYTTSVLTASQYMLGTHYGGVINPHDRHQGELLAEAFCLAGWNNCRKARLTGCSPVACTGVMATDCSDNPIGGVTTANLFDMFNNGVGGVLLVGWGCNGNDYSQKYPPSGVAELFFDKVF